MSAASLIVVRAVIAFAVVAPSAFVSGWYLVGLLVGMCAFVMSKAAAGEPEAKETT